MNSLINKRDQQIGYNFALADLFTILTKESLDGNVDNLKVGEIMKILRECETRRFPETPAKPICEDNVDLFEGEYIRHEKTAVNR